MKDDEKLFDISKDNLFKVPEDYFANFYYNLEKRLNIESKEKTKKSSVVYLISSAVAACLILVFLLYKPIINNNSNIVNNIENVSIDDYISYEDIYYYITENKIETDSSIETEISFNEYYILSTLSDYDIYMGIK